MPQLKDSTIATTPRHAARPSTAKGRGTGQNPPNRFQPLRIESEADPTEAGPATECRAVAARSIIARNRSPDVPFEQSINPYQGCEHGCIYCYARPTHAYLDLSPGVDFETRLTYKPEAATLLGRELSRPGYRCSPIALGTNTDPYQPIEGRFAVTRQILEVLQQCNHPFTVTTKAALITRDIDILAAQARRGLCKVAISLTSLDNDLKRTMEPRAASATARLSAMRELSQAGVPVTVLVAPVIPALNDAELEDILTQACQHGAGTAAYILLRLPLEVGPLFEAWLEEHQPLRAKHVMSVLQQCRGGADYDSRFGHRMRGNGPFAQLLERRFDVACRKLGLQRRQDHQLRRDLFRPPEGAANARQMDMFGGNDQ